MLDERTEIIDGIQFQIPIYGNYILIKSNHGNHSGWNRKFKLLDVYSNQKEAYNDFFNHIANLSDNFVEKDGKYIYDFSTNEEIYTYGDESFEHDLYYYHIDYIEEGCFLEKKLSKTATPLSYIMKYSVYFEVIPQYKLFIDNHHGIYVPQMFYEVLMNEQAFTLENFEHLEEEIYDLSSLNNENYWESWEFVLDNARINIDNDIYLLYQGENGDIFLYNEEEILV